MKPIKITFLVLFANIVVFGQNDSLLLKKNDFESKNKIQIGIVNDYGFQISKAIKNGQYRGLKKGIMYSRNLNFLHKNIWIRGSAFYNNYNTDVSSYRFNLYSIGVDYRFPKLFNRSICFLGGIEYAWSKREKNFSYIGGRNKFLFVNNAVVLNFSLEFGETFFFGISQDYGFSKLYENVVISDENNKIIKEQNGSGFGQVTMKRFVFSFGYKF